MVISTNSRHRTWIGCKESARHRLDEKDKDRRRFRFREKELLENVNRPKLEPRIDVNNANLDTGFMALYACIVSPKFKLSDAALRLIEGRMKRESHLESDDIVEIKDGKQDRKCVKCKSTIKRGDKARRQAYTCNGNRTRNVYTCLNCYSGVQNENCNSEEPVLQELEK
jgi:hypothetical protein